jgi:hypothetical protein
MPKCENRMGREKMECSAKNIAKPCKLALGIAVGLKRKIRIQKRGKERLHFNHIYL